MDPETVEGVHGSLPRGCEEIPPKLPLVKLRTFSEEKWIQEWEGREGVARSLFQSVAEAALTKKLDPQLTPALRKVDEETGLALNVLLARSLDRLKKGELVVVTSNRVGIKGDTETLAVGESFHFTVQMGDSLRGKRRAEGDFIGIVLNVDSQAVRQLSKKGETDISGDLQVSALSALIDAEIARTKTEKAGENQNLFSQADVDRASDFVLFGKR